MGPASDLNPDAAGVTGEHFVVHFGDRNGLASAPRDSLALVGVGSLEISADALTIRGPKPRSFRSAESQQHVFALADISNVVGAGKTLRFQIPSSGGRSRFVIVDAADESAMQRMLQLLPATMAPGFAAELAERADFHRRLDRLSRPPRVTPALVAINVAVFVLMALAGAGVFQPDGEVAIRWGSNFGPMTMAGGQWWRLLTATFIHFGIFHLALNMWALYTAGLMTERLYGSGRFAMLYVFAGLTGSIASLLWNPQVNSAGASGAIFGVFGGMLAFVVKPGNGVPRSVMTEHRNSTLAFIAYNLFCGAAHTGIDNGAHVGGLLGGFLIGLLLARPLDEQRLQDSGGMRLAAIGGAAALFLGLALLPLINVDEKVHASQAFDVALMGFDAKQQRAMDATRDALALANAGTTDANAVAAQKLLSDVVPLWAALNQEIAAPRLAEDDPQAHRQQLMKQYLDGRRRQYELVARAVLEQNPALETQAAAADIEAGKAVDELNGKTK